MNIKVDTKGRIEGGSTLILACKVALFIFIATLIFLTQERIFKQTCLSCWIHRTYVPYIWPFLQARLLLRYHYLSIFLSIYQWSRAQCNFQAIFLVGISIVQMSFVLSLSWCGVVCAQQARKLLKCSIFPQRVTSLFAFKNTEQFSSSSKNNGWNVYSLDKASVFPFLPPPPPPPLLLPD